MDVRGKVTNGKRLIDADALISYMDECSKESRFRVYYGYAKSFIDDAPTIDAVPVVRKPVVGYEGYYEVDQLGRVFGVDRVISVDDNGRKYKKPIAGNQMKQSLKNKGYKVVSLTKDGITKMVYVHRIVAEAFIPNPDNLPMVNHKDEDKTNNFIENLEWCTAKYNCNYGTGVKRHGRWIDKGEYAVCMECGGRSGTQYDGVEPIPLMTQFCPNCGCRMDGGAD